MISNLPCSIDTDDHPQRDRKILGKHHNDENLGILAKCPPDHYCHPDLRYCVVKDNVDTNLKFSMDEGKAKECDPFAPDTGILACGEGFYCVESQKSSTGGVCFHDHDISIAATQSNRQAQIYIIDYCDGLYCTAQLDCTVDPDTGNGIYSCYRISEQCLEPLESCCYSYARNYYFSYGGGSTNNSYIGRIAFYYFVEPYSQNVSVSYTFGSSDCDIIFNGVTCNSCTMITRGCYYFDCTNAPSGQDGNTCDNIYSLIPIYEHCAVGSLDEPCYVCPDNAPVTNPDNLVQTPGQPVVSCGQLQEFGRQGLIPPDLCAATQVAVPALCGCGTLEQPSDPPSDMPAQPPSDPPVDPPSNPPSDMPVESPSDPPVEPPSNPPSDMPVESQIDPLCLVCPNDEPVTNPDNPIQIPGQSNVNCEQLQEFGRQGSISADLCTPAQSAVEAICGCGKLSPPIVPPSGSPNYMPVESVEQPGTSPPVSSTDSPTTLPIKEPNPNQSKTSEDGNGMLYGLIAGGIVIIVILFILGFSIWRKNQARGKENKQSLPVNNEETEEAVAENDKMPEENPPVANTMDVQYLPCTPPIDTHVPVMATAALPVVVVAMGLKETPETKLGITLGRAEGSNRIYISRISETSIFADQGLSCGMIIRTIDGIPIRTLQQASDILTKHRGMMTIEAEVEAVAQPLLVANL